MKEFFLKNIDRDIPRKLRNGKFPYSSILYILLSSLVFMLLYIPFSTSAWFSVRTPASAFFTGIFIVAAIGILSASSSLFAAFCRKRKTVKLWHYILWCVAEIIVISVAYAFLTKFFSLGDYSSDLSLWGKTILCVTLILSIPCSVIYLRAAGRERLRRSASVGRYGEDAEERRERQAESLKERMIKFTDDDGELRFSVDVDSVLYVKADGNYVNIFYENGDGVASYALKTPIGTLETRLSGTPLVRCQRSYIVNTRRVRMMQNDSRAMCIIVDNDTVPVIPMSQNYASAVSDALGSQS